MRWLAWRWTHHTGAALVAGSLFAFNAHSLVSMGHIQAIHAYGLPLLLVGLDGLCDPRSRGHRGRTAHGHRDRTAGAHVGLSRDLRRRVRSHRCRRAVARAADATAAAADRGAIAGGILMAIPVVPVMQRVREIVQRTQGFARSLDLVASLSANGAAYRPRRRGCIESWARSVYQAMEPRDSLFPGVIATLLALTGVALWQGGLSRSAAACRARADRRRRAAVVRPGDAVLHALLLGRAVCQQRPRGVAVRRALSQRPRAAGGVRRGRPRSRAGRGWPSLRRHSRSGRQRRGVPGAGAVRAARPEPSPVYDTLASLPDGVVAEMPFWWRPMDVPRNANYMLASTRHWKPLLNGYSGFTPASYGSAPTSSGTFPSGRPASTNSTAPGCATS